MVLDASALIAFLEREPGGERVRDLLPEVAVSTVNLSEVLQRQAERGLPAARERHELELLGMEVVPFDALAAEQTAELRPATLRSGLSLADRACLALARRLAVPAVTADRVWVTLDLDIEIELIR